MNWIKNLALVCFSSLLPVIGFLFVDLAIGWSRLDADPAKCEACEKNENFKGGWYELKPGFDEHVFAYKGKRRTRITIDERRYRVGSSENECLDVCTDLLFLGDSFTFGSALEWDDTFVGMVQSDSPEFNVINGGNQSYSVTAYNYIYQRYLRTRDNESAHLVVVAVDISDVQDEASIWRADADHKAGIGHPVMFQRVLDENSDGFGNKDYSSGIYPLEGYLPYTHSILGYFKYVFSKNDDYLTNRAAFTHKDWKVLDQDYAQDGYLPRGVSGGIARVESGLKHLLREIEKHNGEAIFLVYPWPNQLAFQDTHFDWSEFIRTICMEEDCVGVVDVFAIMREYKQSHPDEWYPDLYSTGDIHFNSFGNRIIADELLEFLAARNSNTNDLEDKSLIPR